MLKPGEILFQPPPADSSFPALRPKKENSKEGRLEQYKAEEEKDEGEKLVEKLVEKLKKEPSDEEKLAELIKQTTRVLFSATNIFPFDLFPDSIVINVDRISVINRQFFGSEQVYTILVKDLADTAIETIPFFATLVIIDDRYKDKPVKVRFLSRQDAIKARRILQGLILGREQKIDFSKLKDPNLAKKIEALGKIRE